LIVFPKSREDFNFVVIVVADAVVFSVANADDAIAVAAVVVALSVDDV